MHANSPEDALRRIETLALMAGIGLPHDAIREQVRRGIRLVVHLARGADGARGGWSTVGEVVVGRRRGRRPGGLDAVSGGILGTPVLLAAAAGGMAAVAVREAIIASPALGRWLAATVEPLRRAGREGYAPTDAERRRLAVLGTVALLLAGFMVGRPGPGAVPRRSPAPAPRPGRCRRRRARYRRAVERGMPQIATAVADALAGGRSVRAALAAAAASVEGPAGGGAGARCGRISSSARRRRMPWARSRRGSARPGSTRSPPRSSPSSSAAATSPGLLRRFAASAAERDRVVADARSATAQARFTGLLVVAMPTGAALFAELIQPGFVGALLANGASLALLGRRCRVPGGRLRRDPAPQQDRGRLACPAAAPH